MNWIRHFNQELPLSDWLSIREYEPAERQENDEIIWHLGRNPSDKLEKIMTIGIYKSHAFLIKTSISYQSFISVLIVEHASHKLVSFNYKQNFAQKEEQLSIAKTSVSKFHRRRTRERSTPKHQLRPHRCAGLSAQGSCWKRIYIMPYAVTEVRGGLLEPRWMVMTGNRKQSTNTTGAGGTVAGGVSPIETRESRMERREKSFTNASNRGPHQRAPCRLLQCGREIGVTEQKKLRRLA